MSIVTTNYHPRPVRSWHDMPEAERLEHCYDRAKNGYYVKYLGTWYNIGLFERITSYQRHLYAEGWHGSCAETAFSVIVFKATEDHDFVIMGYVGP